jgi:hypothetical protein
MSLGGVPLLNTLAGLPFYRMLQEPTEAHYAPATSYFEIVDDAVDDGVAHEDPFTAGGFGKEGGWSSCPADRAVIRC